MESSIGVVICLYNPDLDILSKNLSVLKNLQIFTILVDDYSSVSLDSIVHEFKNSQFILMKKSENLGIGNSLNIGCDYLLKNNFTWVLTLDQDTKLEEEWIEKLLIAKNKYEKLLRNAFIFHSIPKDPRTDQIFYYKINSTELKDVGISHFSFTSGSLMSLEVWQKLGRFNEELFLDYIDIDICFRARISGYKIYAIENAVMSHPVGNRMFYNLWNAKIVLINHSPIRNYYVVRNAYLMRKKYGKIFPEFKKGDRYFILKKCIKAILFEDQKLKKLYYIMVGLIHGFLGITGKYK